MSSLKRQTESPMEGIEPKRRASSEETETVDHLSNLPDDCLLDVLGRVDLFDNYEFALLSRRMSRVAESGRSRARDVVATELIVKQEGSMDQSDAPGSLYPASSMDTRTSVERWMNRRVEDDRSLHIRMKCAGVYYVFNMRSASDGSFKKQSSSDYVDIFPIHPPDYANAIDQAASILEIFDFKTIDINSITIDDRFLSLFERSTSCSTFVNFEAKNCLVNSNLNKARFIQWLLSTKPRAISLGFECDVPFFDEKFLRDFVLAVRFPYLKIISSDSTLLQPDDDFAETLSLFKTINMSRLVINLDWLLVPLLKRLRRKLVGTWEFRTTRKIGSEEIEAMIDSDMEYKRDSSFSSKVYNLEITGTEHSVEFQTNRCDETLWIFSATFQRAMS